MHKVVPCQWSLEVKMKAEEHNQQHFPHEKPRGGGGSELDLKDQTSRWELTLPSAAWSDSSLPSSTAGLTPGRAAAKPALRNHQAPLSVLGRAGWELDSDMLLGKHPETPPLEKRGPHQRDDECLCWKELVSA